METKEINIQVPTGYEIDKENSTFEKIVFKEVEHCSKNWEKFCANNPYVYEESRILPDSTILTYRTDAIKRLRDSRYDKNLIPSKFAKPILALMQLLTIREKEYTKGWEPDLYNDYWGILFGREKEFRAFLFRFCPLTFPTEDLANKFIRDWKHLLLIARPLLG